MSSRDLSISPAAVGASCAVVGAGLGYWSAPEKYNLRQLLTQDPDVFEKVIKKTALDKANNVQKNAYQSIVDARKTVAEAVKNNKGDEKVTELLKSEDLKNSFKDLRKFIPKARVQTMIIGAAVLGVLGALARIVFGDNTPKTK